jgi:hypothetical protein
LESCTKTISVDNIKNIDELEKQISKDLKVPFHNIDTLFLDLSGPVLCGTPAPTKEFVEKIFVPKTDSSVYLAYLKRNLSNSTQIIKKLPDKPIFVSSKEFVDLQSSGKEYDGFLKNKVVLKVDGYLISNDTVSISETFHHCDSLITIEKIFIFNDDRWSSNTVKRTFMTRDYNNNNSWRIIK